MGDYVQGIGEASGKLYRALERGSKTISALQKDSGVKDEALFYQAIGWLARENKIYFDNKSKGLKISLCCAESSCSCR
jgi:hypothetical protein